MRLIYIAPYLHPVGGLERTLADKANYLVANGHEVMFLTYNQGKEKVFYPLDDRVTQIDIDCPIFTLYRYPFLFRLNHYLRLRWQFRERMKVVLGDYRPDVIVITIPNTEDYIYDIFRLSANVRVVIESHLASSHHLIRKSLTERLLCKLFPPIKAIRRADLLIALTEHDAAYWRKQKVPHVTVIPNPLTDYPDNLNEEKVHGRIICVGRLYEQKRFDRLIDAFALIAAKYPEWSVDIFGKGPLQEDLQNRIDNQKLTGRVRLNQPTHDIFNEYQRSQFFVLSSDYEGFGLVITEAMACGLPVVSTDCPYGPSEIVEDGKTGLLTKMDVADLAAKMEWMITHDSERQLMGQAAHQTAARYRLDRVMSEWERAYF